MNIFIPVSYGGKAYPHGITPSLTEVAGHFDKESIKKISNYSLHTEYSHSGRKLTNPLLASNSNSITLYTQKSVPLLWYNKDWSKDFYNFLVRLIGDNPPPTILEIHPPFKSYCNNFERFLSVYAPFEEMFLKRYPNCKILIENRCGNILYNDFLFSSHEDYLNFSKLLDSSSLSLKLILDVPQIITANKLTPNNFNNINIIFDALKKVKHNISSIHLWGKDENSTPHKGDLNSYFRNNEYFKLIFLKLLYETFNDNTPRYFVPEVNSTKKDLDSIINDLLATGFKFINL